MTAGSVPAQLCNSPVRPLNAHEEALVVTVSAGRAATETETFELRADALQCAFVAQVLRSAGCVVEQLSTDELPGAVHLLRAINVAGSAAFDVKTVADQLPDAVSGLDASADGQSAIRAAVGDAASAAAAAVTAGAAAVGSVLPAAAVAAVVGVLQTLVDAPYIGTVARVLLLCYRSRWVDAPGDSHFLD
jgi:hypothetical protein